MQNQEYEKNVAGKSEKDGEVLNHICECGSFAVTQDYESKR
jgi:hypothetical protein